MLFGLPAILPHHAAVLRLRFLKHTCSRKALKSRPKGRGFYPEDFDEPDPRPSSVPHAPPHGLRRGSRYVWLDRLVPDQQLPVFLTQRRTEKGIQPYRLPLFPAPQSSHLRDQRGNPQGREADTLRVGTS